ncbi:bifunctional epoxide hydrolase 2-like [Actinia tenebrosa]|uniref:Bifunctional epoxide hydrolase 2-like n=1 Tax=Actinia tenebrosa TaxID=6105 RepID=A0A6P8IH33_ACTTE|nr:bifunctional epoxide hydrolase 2-like [Actinia tenebrosa]
MSKLVIFDLGGVVATTPVYTIQQFAWEKGVPSQLLQKLFLPSDEMHPMFQLEVGIISLSQFYKLADELVLKLADEEGIKLHKDFSIEGLFKKIPKSLNAVPEMLNASAALREKGIKTCILTNNWTDDTETGLLVSNLMRLRYYFDDVFESCKLGLRKPDGEAFKVVCEKMGANINEAIVLDDLPNNLKPAKELGMTTIQVKDPFSALKTLKEITGVDVFAPHPVSPCSPNEVPHCFVTLKTGIKMHYVDVGQGPAVILLHGFPEFWYIWKYQIPALALAGFRVIAPDLRGYGQTTSPSEIVAYGRENLSKDIISLLDCLLLPQVTVVGHDWGGVIAWDLAIHYSDRVRAIANMTPYQPPNPTVNPLKALQAKPGVFQYQLYFHKEGEAEKEFESDLRKTFIYMLRYSTDQLMGGELSTANVLERGGIFKGFPENVEKSPMITEQDLDYFVESFTKTGFRGALNWYRNTERNWLWSLKVVGRKIQQPSLMITCGQDQVISPALSAHMKDWAVKLSQVHIEESSHWTPLDCPLKLNNILIDWMKKIKDGADTSKL